MALLMVIICIGSFLQMLLLHFRCYFHRIHIHSHFSFGLYWILGFVQLYSFLFGFYTYERILWINFNVLRQKFVILRVSGQNINGEYHLNTCKDSLFSFCFVWPGGNVVFILIICGLHTFLLALFYIMFYSF